MHQVFLALGSNLKEPIQQIRSALVHLEGLEKTQVVKASSLYLNPPVGYLNQPEFANAVVEIKTFLSPEALLRSILLIEALHGRIRGEERNGPRVLDIDILLFDQKLIETDVLQIPHPRLKERAFVVVPLAEIAPELILPCGNAIKALQATFKDAALTPITELV